MQNATKQTSGFQRREELEKEGSLSSSGSSLGTHEDLAAWGGKTTKVSLKEIGMASAQRHFSQGLIQSDRMSNATVFESDFGEEGKPAASPPPPLKERAGKAPFPVPPPDMEDIA